MKTVFFGTPAIGIPALRALHATNDVVGVVCQPDRKAGRGMKISPCPIKNEALRLGLEVFQPTRVRDGALQRWLAERQLDAAVVFAYGRILPEAVLNTPRLGCVNLHASLLPKYRGAAPIQWAIANGETETGISLMQMDSGLDTGAVFTTRTLAIPPFTNGGQLTEMLGELAVEVIHSDLPEVASGKVPTPQDESKATHAPLIQPQHLAVDFSLPAIQIANQIRAFAPSPAAFCFAGKKRLKLLAATPFAQDTSHPSSIPGGVVAANRGLLLIQTGAGLLSLLDAQLEGKRAMNARDLINGRAIVEGLVLSNTPHEQVALDD